MKDPLPHEPQRSRGAPGPDRDSDRLDRMPGVPEGDWIFAGAFARRDARVAAADGDPAAARRLRVLAALEARSPRDPAADEPDPERALLGCVREAAPVRRALCAVAARLVETRAWSTLGFARLRDYAAERVGMSVRSLHEMARVHALLAAAPRIDAAFLAGRVGWTSLRVLARLDQIDDEAFWLEQMKRLSPSELGAAVRHAIRDPVSSRDTAAAAATGSGAVVYDASSSSPVLSPVPVRCTPTVRAKWVFGCELARRVAGRRLPTWECAEVIAAEVSSAIPTDPEGRCDLDEPLDPGGDLAQALATHAADQRGLAVACAGRVEDACADAAPDAVPPGPPGARDPESRLARLVEGLDDSDAHDLDRRLRAGMRIERTHEARIGPLLRAVVERRRYRWRGYWNLERYAEERLGLCIRKVRGLVRIERALEIAPALARAYRAGRVSWVQTQSLVSLVEAGLRGPRLEAWVDHAQGVSVRRLEDDVRVARMLADTDRAAFETRGGLPEDADVPRSARQAGAHERRREATPPRQAGAHAETCELVFRAPPEAERFFRAVLESVRRRLQASSGAPVDEGRALEAMLDHVLRAWGERDASVRLHHRILERDGYRCAVPGCSSHRNLQVHHIVFRSHGGGDAPENLVTLCAWHHHRGVHAGRIRCSGRAPDGLRFTLGLRDGGPPLVVYAPGERIEASHPPREPGPAAAG